MRCHIVSLVDERSMARTLRLHPLHCKIYFHRHIFVGASSDALPVSWIEACSVGHAYLYRVVSDAMDRQYDKRIIMFGII